MSSGMTKAGTGAKLEESNCALLGSELEKNVKKAAAESEKEWKGCGKLDGKDTNLEIWRIENFAVKKWPKEKYGSFFDGDSYIILYTYKVEDKIMYNVHFWLGTYTTQDEYGTAAYKTVELDTLLDDLPVQYREVQGSESELFHSYFKHIKILKGGVESGFNHVEPEKYQPRLFQFKGKTKPVLDMVPLYCESLNEGDVFVLDAGLKAWTWVGSNAGVFEKKSANDYIDMIEGERKDLKKVLLESGKDDDEEFWKLLGGKGTIQSAAEGGSDKAAEDDAKKNTKVVRIHVEEGGAKESTFQNVADGEDLGKEVLDEGDAFIVSKSNSVFVWIGKDANASEKLLAMSNAAAYIKVTSLPFGTQVCRILSGQTNQQFDALFPKGGEPKAAPPKTAATDGAAPGGCCVVM